MKKTALIMAGGKGERFWPRSRKNRPKQFLSLTGDEKTMIQLTVERILPLVDMEDIYIATNRDYRELVREQLPDLPEENILCEPVGRNTAPCIGLGAAHMARKYPDAVMMVLASDHLIQKPQVFRQDLERACQVAEEGENLVTLGIHPTYPETGYGYICHEKEAVSPGTRVYPVERFVEKPDRKTAEAYLASGHYLWNSGMFVWKVSTIQKKLAQYMPELAAGLKKIQEAVGTPEQEAVLEREFPQFPSESVDYGIMEKADRIYTIPGDFGWDDVGSWLAVERIRPADGQGNVLEGNVVTVGTSRSTIQGGRKLIAAVGLEDLIVVDTQDAILICAKDQAGDIKKVLEELRNQGSSQYL